MQNAKGLSLALLASVSLLLGCQKQIADESAATSPRLLNVSPKISGPDCPCLPRVDPSDPTNPDWDPWSLTPQSDIEFPDELNTQLYLSAAHDATAITYLHLTTSPGSFTWVDYEVIFHDVSEGSTDILLTRDDPSAPGNATDRDLLKTKEGVDLVTPAGRLELPEDWEGCDYIEVHLIGAGGTGFGASTPRMSANYYLRELCPLCLDYAYHTAYAGETTGDNSAGNQAWYYLFDVTGPATQTIYASQNIEIGTVTYDGSSFEITLNSGWDLDPVKTASVKVQGFTTAPTERPTPGQSDLQGSSLTVDLTGYTYPLYAIHLDIRECLTSLPE